MGFGPLPATTICRAPRWEAPPSSWFAPHHFVTMAKAMSEIGDCGKPPTSPESDYESSNSSSDSHDSPLYCASRYTTSPDVVLKSTPTRAESELPAICSWIGCGKSFNKLDLLSAHVGAVHATVQGGLFYCGWEGCPRGHRGFNARYKMLVHVRTHTKERPHACMVCGKSFSRAENLKIHARSHSGEKPYICTVPGCGKAYSNSSDRFKHTRTHMVEKPYCCKIPGCQKRYTDPSSLRKHVKTYKHANNSEESLNTQTENPSNVPTSMNASDKEFTPKVFKSFSKSDAYDHDFTKQCNFRKHTNSENDSAMLENTNIQPIKLGAKNMSNYDSVMAVDEDEYNKLCFCKDLPCIHTNRYVQPEYIRCDSLLYDKIEEKTSFLHPVELSDTIMNEPLNLKRRYFENNFSTLDKLNAKTEYCNILIDNCTEAPLDLSNKKFF